MDQKGVRIDKWLWCVRLYKSRSLATAACDSGKVRVDDRPVKPSRAVKPGDLVTAVTGTVTRTVKVLATLEARVGASRVPEFLTDLTPQSEYEKPRHDLSKPGGFRPKGSGRPTKRDRRILQSFFE